MIVFNFFNQRTLLHFNMSYPGYSSIFTLNTAYISLCFKLVPVQYRELLVRECRHCILVLNHFLKIDLDIN